MNDADSGLRWPMKRRTGCPYDPPPELAALREDFSALEVTLYNGEVATLLTRHEEISRALRSKTVSADGNSPGFPSSTPAMTIQRSSPNRSFARSDPPEHTRVRASLQAMFTRAEAELLRPQIESLVGGLVDDLVAAGPGTDLVRVLSEPLPATVTCLVLGLPLEDGAFFHEAASRWHDLDAPAEVTQAAVADLVEYFERLVVDRAKAPREDIVSLLVSEMNAGVITHDDVIAALLILLVGGFSTTANMIALSALTLLNHPEQLAALLRQPDRWANAVEELLRYLTVAHQEGLRATTASTDLGSCVVAAGTGIIAPLMAANRDPRIFADPDRFDIKRDTRRHLAFGLGLHQCLGQHVARIEVEAALRGLFGRLPELRLAEDPSALAFVETEVIYGVRRLCVSW
jgi:cytochrome P450